jgi:hypothetical protein
VPAVPLTAARNRSKFTSTKKNDNTLQFLGPDGHTSIRPFFDVQSRKCPSGFHLRNGIIVMSEPSEGQMMITRLHGTWRYCSDSAFQIEYVAMDTGIQIQSIWCDADVTEILVSAWNGTFGGVTRIYVGIGALKEAAEQLRGFPSTPTDNREITFGQFDLGPVRVGQTDVNVFASGISMRFHCLNGAGHAHLDLRLQSDNREGTSVGYGERPGRTIQNVVLVMRIDATGVDTFVQELLRLEATRAGAAHLKSLVSDGDRTFGSADLPNSR